MSDHVEALFAASDTLKNAGVEYRIETYQDGHRMTVTSIGWPVEQVPPGRCGASLDGLPHLSCELLAGHAGMHQDRVYQEGVVSAGELAYWNDGDPDGAYRQVSS